MPPRGGRQTLAMKRGCVGLAWMRVEADSLSTACSVSFELDVDARVLRLRDGCDREGGGGVLLVLLREAEAPCAELLLLEAPASRGWAAPFRVVGMVVYMKQAA